MTTFNGLGVTWDPHNFSDTAVLAIRHMGEGMNANPTDSTIRTGLGSRGGLQALQPDTMLCARAARGDEAAFALLYSRYRQPVFAFVFHLLGRSGSVDDAEDLTQEIMQKAYTNLSTRRAGGSFKAWLFRIARNHTFDHIRARRSPTMSIDDAEATQAVSNVVSLHGEVERRAELAWLLTAMGALPERQRQALVMRELGGQSVAEIAEALQTSPESAKQLIKRGRASIGTAATASGYKSKKIGRELAAVAPITSIAWLGAGKASAATGIGAAISAGASGAAATGGGVASGVGGAGLVVASTKVVATVMAVAAIGAGGVVATERVSSRNDQPATSKAVAAQPASAGLDRSLAVGVATTGHAAEEKARASERRKLAHKRARLRRARARARAKHKRADARAKARRRFKSSVRGKPTAPGNSGGAGTQHAGANAKPKATPAAPPAASGGAKDTGGGSKQPRGGKAQAGNGGGKPK